MNKIIRKFKTNFTSCTMDEKILIGVAVSIFLPFVITAIAVIGAVCYVTYTKKWKMIFKRVPYAYVLMVFCVLITAVSIFYGNWLGAAAGAGIAVLMLFVMYYRVYITKSVFEMIVDIAIVLSIICCIYALFEYVYRVSVVLGWDVMKLKIPSQRQYRIRVGFFNANYFAMMLEFVMLLCIYKMKDLRNIKKIAYYIGALFLHFIVLYLTGCRTGLPAIVAGIAVILILNKNKVFLGLFGIGVAGGLGLAILKPTLIPRTTFLARNFQVRMKIWNAAIIGIKEHFLLGQGPLTYFFTWKKYKGHNTQHAHSVYLDPFMSFGIIGVVLAGIYLFGNFREVWHLFRRKLDQQLFALILAFVSVVLVHGVFDYTIFWIQTALLFFMVLSASSMYHENVHVEIK